MKHFYKLLLPIFLFPIFSFAQGNYKPGYVVALNGDTLKGYIDYKDWDRNPRTITFKNNPGAKQKQQYNTGNIVAFALYGFESYKRFAGWISQDKLDMSGTRTGIDTAKTRDTVFLRVLNMGGPLTLYAYKDSKKERFFIRDNGSEPTELAYHEYLEYNKDQGKTNIATQHGYRIHLNRLALKYQPQNPGIITQIQNAAYNETSLYNITAKINGLGNLQHYASSHNGARFFAGIAANNSAVSFSNDDFGLRNASGSTVFPKINFGADLFINKNVRTLSFRTELYFTANHVNITGSTPGDGYTDHETLKFNQFIASINPQILYNFYNTDKTKIYVAGGLALNYNAFSNKEYDVVFQFGSISKAVIPREFPEMPNLDLSITAKIGCELNSRVNIYAGYNPATKLNDDVGYGIYLTSYYAGINYLFGNK